MEPLPADAARYIAQEFALLEFARDIAAGEVIGLAAGLFVAAGFHAVGQAELAFTVVGGTVSIICLLQAF